jgi:hypothetical protein
MRKLILLMAISTLLYIGCHNEKESNLKVNVNVISKLDPKIIYNKEVPLYSIDIDLINHTDSVVRFWIMNCSWPDSWISNHNLVGLYCCVCDMNYPVIRQIDAGQKITFKGTLMVLDSLEDVKKYDLKLGFVFVKEKDYSIKDGGSFRELVLDKGKESKDIIWSELFRIKE